MQRGGRQWKEPFFSVVEAKFQLGLHIWYDKPAHYLSEAISSDLKL